ncbi:MAG: hypothetical protein J6I64_03030 [Lachnospiraceae bacterium]|nr:hypothetical protein [Lachnospiraceae bacterium]
MNMRTFDYFLYGNYDACQVRCEQDDPRRVLNSSTDSILTEVVQLPPTTCNYEKLCLRHGQEVVNHLIHIGLLRLNGQAVLLDAPVIVQEDTADLQTCFFNGISERDIVATSKIQKSGLDYLIIVYERSEELDRFSRELLCSYNRFSDGTKTLQSFGDSAGNRKDVFRFLCQKRLGQVPESMQEIEAVWDSIDSNSIRDVLLTETHRLIETGQCDESCHRLLSLFGYVRDGSVVVPVYKKEKSIEIM